MRVVTQKLIILQACFTIGMMLSDWQIICCTGPTRRERDRHRGMMGDGELGCKVAMNYVQYDGWHSVLPGDPAVTSVPATSQWLVWVWLLSV